MRACCGGEADHVVRVVLGIKGRRGAWVERLAVQAIGFMPVQDLPSVRCALVRNRTTAPPAPSSTVAADDRSRALFLRGPVESSGACLRMPSASRRGGGRGGMGPSVCVGWQFSVGRGNLGACVCAGAHMRVHRDRVGARTGCACGWPSRRGGPQRAGGPSPRGRASRRKRGGARCATGRLCSQRLSVCSTWR